MKSSAGKILSFNNRSLTLSNNLGRWQTFIPQLICLLTLWSDKTDNDWKKFPLKLRWDKTSDLKNPILAFSSRNYLTK